MEELASLINDPNVWYHFLSAMDTSSTRIGFIFPLVWLNNVSKDGQGTSRRFFIPASLCSLTFSHIDGKHFNVPVLFLTSFNPS